MSTSDPSPDPSAGGTVRDPRWRATASAQASAASHSHTAGSDAAAHPSRSAPASPPDPLRRFFGGNPAAVLLRLMLLSIIVGIIFAVLGLDPRSLFEALGDLVRTMVQNSAELIEALIRYFLLGAAIVFPIWLVLRLLSTARRPPNP